MLQQVLKSLVDQKKREGLSNNVIHNLLKEALQFYVLDFIYNSAYGRDLFFTGGSALRICHDLNRLSEDLDFDAKQGQRINQEKIAADLIDHFKKRLSFPNIEATISGRKKKIYLKFPIFHDLKVSQESESEKLYVKLEIMENISKYYQTEFIPVSKFDLNFVVQIYDLPTLMSSKIIAVLKRTFKKGKGDEITFKGRDYYDLLWFLQKGIIPNMKRLNDVLGTVDKKEIYQMLWGKVKEINLAYLEEDIFAFFEDGRFIKNYCEHYKEMTKRHLVD